MLVAFSAFAWAACPPGARIINAAGINNVAVAPGVGPELADALTGQVPLFANTTYCVDADTVLGAGGWVLADHIALQNNTRIVGAHPGVRVTASAAAIPLLNPDPIFELQGSGGELNGFSIYQDPAGVALMAVDFFAAASDSVMRDMTIVDNPVAPGAFAGAVFVRILGGLNITIQGSTLRNSIGTLAAYNGILIAGGNNHHIIDNRVDILAAGEPLFGAINSVLGNGHEILRSLVTNQAVTTAIQINVLTTNTRVDSNIITLNGGAGLAAIGIFVGNAMIDVTNSTITNPGGVAVAGNLVGIMVGVAGTNALIEGNRVTGCGTNVALVNGDAILVGAANVTVQNNPTLQVGTAGVLVGTDIACGVNVAAGASGVKVLNNPNINSATSGIFVGAPNTEVRGNTITDSCTGAAVPGMLAPNVPGGIVGAAPGSVSAPIDGNKIMNVSQRNPAVVGSGSGIVMIGGSSNQYITNNEVHNAANNGIEVANAASVGNQIIGNKVYHSTANGFNIQVAASNTRVKGNTFQDNRNSGVFVTGGALNTIVQDNLLENNGSQGSPPVAPNVAESKKQ